MLTDEHENYVPVRAEWLGQISVFAHHGPQGVYTPFAQAQLQDSSRSDVVELESVEQIIAHDEMVCADDGKLLLVRSQTKVSLIARSPFTCKFSSLADCQLINQQLTSSTQSTGSPPPTDRCSSLILIAL